LEEFSFRKMVNFLSIVPEGFHSVINILNNFPNMEVLSSMIEEIIKYLNKKGLGCYVEDYSEICKKLEIDIKDIDLKNIINLLTYIFREAYKFEVEKDDFPKYLKQNTQIKVDIIKLFHSFYQKPVFIINLNY
jgi:hypothetical protein